VRAALGAPGRAAPLPGGGPLLGHAPRAVEARLAAGRRVAQDHAARAVGDLAQGVAVLAGHPGRAPPLGEAGLVNAQDAGRAARLGHDVRARVAADRLGVPGGALPAQRPAAGRGSAGVRRPLPAGRARDVGAQPPRGVRDVPPRRRAPRARPAQSAHALPGPGRPRPPPRRPPTRALGCQQRHSPPAAPHR